MIAVVLTPHLRLLSIWWFTDFRCYSPIVFGKKTDPNGDYIRKWLPQFKNFPAKFIYEPWEAPLAMQQKLGVVIGKDYPEPIVDHKTISKSNMGRMKEAYDAHKAAEQDGPVPAAPAPANGSRRNASSSTTKTSSSKRRKT
jgi:cryptochrome